MATEKNPHDSGAFPAYSLIIPIYNEEANIPLLVPSLLPVMEKLRQPFEIILVDDGSTDSSYERMVQFSEIYPQLVLVKFRSRSGQTAAFDAGFRLARGNVVITMDGDLQYDPSDILKLIPYLEAADVVCGWRERRADTLVRRVSSVVANAIRNALSQEQIQDVGCSLRVFKRESLKTLKLHNGMHRFLPTLLKLDGFKVVEVPVQHFPRRYGLSKYNIRNRAIRSFVDLLAVRWMKRRWLKYEIEEVKQCGGTFGSHSD
jgi:glycosyltransferase involved in cell wall biosynthesis